MAGIREALLDAIVDLETARQLTERALRAVDAAAAGSAAGATAAASSTTSTHMWSDPRQFTDTNNVHGRECLVCGMRQHYGKVYGSKRHPAWERVPETCFGTNNPLNQIVLAAAALASEREEGSMRTMTQSRPWA